MLLHVGTLFLSWLIIFLKVYQILEIKTKHPRTIFSLLQLVTMPVSIRELPFDIQIKILSHLSASDVNNIQKIFPERWKHSCNSIIVWRELVTNNLRSTPILDSNYAFKLIDVLANANAGKNKASASSITSCSPVTEGISSLNSSIDPKTKTQICSSSNPHEISDHQKYEISQKLQLLETSIQNYKEDLNKWKSNYQDNIFSLGLGVIKNTIKTTFMYDKTPEMLFWGPGLENDRSQQSAEFMTRIMWERENTILKTTGLTPHGGIKLKYLKGTFRAEFIIKALYKCTRRERQAAEQNYLTAENRRGAFNTDGSGNFEISRTILGKVRQNHHFCLCLSDKYNYEKDESLFEILAEYRAELHAYILENVRFRIMEQREKMIQNTVTEVKLGILLMKDDTSGSSTIDSDHQGSSTSTGSSTSPYNLLNIVKNFDLINLESKVRKLCQELESNLVLTSGNYSTIHNSRFILHWRVSEGNYKDLDTIDTMFQWILG